VGFDKSEINITEGFKLLEPYLKGKTMKKSIMIVVLALMGFGASHLIKADLREPRQPRDVVVLQYQQMGRENPPIGYLYTGIFVYVSSSTTNAPTFPQYQYGIDNQLTSLADALSILLSEGYHIQVNDSTTGTLIVVR
jgi:hypothetical protein